MPPLDPHPIAVISRLTQEIAKLVEQQSKALQAAIYVGMTRQEALNYDDLRKRIAEMRQALNLLRGALNERPSPSEAASEGDLH